MSCEIDGVQQRHRTCSSKYGGAPCLGESIEERICNRGVSCLGNYLKQNYQCNDPDLLF